MNTERDKFLTEARGLCWHDWKGTDGNTTWHKCSKCRLEANFYKSPEQQNFSTWESFGILWEWFTKQNWRGTFSKFHTIGSDKDNMAILQMYINPDKFADAIYDFLKEKRNEIHFKQNHGNGL